MIGPCTSRAIACTASKSPGDAIGKPASITSTPSRASWCAISSFSPVLSEMPGDCSPSRRVVSKMWTRSSVMSPPLAGCSFLSPLGSRLRGRHALFPPRGEEEKEEVQPEGHSGSSLLHVSLLLEPPGLLRLPDHLGHPHAH